MNPEAVDEPRAEYTRRLNRYRELKTRQERREVLLGNARVVVFIAGIILLYFVIGPARLSPIWLALPVGVFVFLVQRHEQVLRSLVRAQRAAMYYEKGLARLEGNWPGTGEPGTRFLSEDHPYTLDLDVFGRGSVFERLSTARTRAGEDTLADWLRSVAPLDAIHARQIAVAELRNRLDLREDIALLGADVPLGVDLAALAVWGTRPRVLAGRWGRPIAAVLVALVVMTLVGWIGGDLSLIPFTLALALEGLFGWSLQQRVAEVMGPVGRNAQDLSLFAGLLSRLEREKFTADRLCRIQEALAGTGSPPSWRITQLAHLVHWLDCTRNVYFGAVAPLLLWKTQLAFAFESWRAISGPAIGPWLAAVAEFEALCSLAAYAYENPTDPFPELLAEGPYYEGEGLGHPLLAEDRLVRNDLRLGSVLRVLVVSGSNMSGKSTLLRTVGVNAVLAFAGAPVRAKRLRLSPLAIGATLRIQDSLQAGRSRFFAEISRIRVLVDLASGKLPLLFLLDEIFHGTNSHDRRLGAEALVRNLVELGAIGLMTTHDLALTHIVEQLAPRADNVHFEDHFENGAICFDFLLRPGVVEKSNALALMRAVGLKV